MAEGQPHAMFYYSVSGPCLVWTNGRVEEYTGVLVLVC